MRSKLTLYLVGLIVSLFLLTIITDHLLPAMLASIFTWVLILLLVIIFPAEKFSRNIYQYFFITFIGCISLPVILHLLSPGHMYYVYKVNNDKYLWIKYLWEVKEEILLFSGAIFGVAVIYSFRIIKQLKDNCFVVSKQS